MYTVLQNDDECKTKPGGLSPPGKVVSHQLASVGVLQPKLNQPRRNRGSSNLGKACRRRDIDLRRSGKDWVIEEVKNIGPELERMRFAEVESLLKRNVPVLLIGSAERITWRGSPSRSLRAGTIRQVWRCTKALGSEVMIEPLLRRSASVRLCNSAAEELGGATSGAK